MMTIISTGKTEIECKLFYETGMEKNQKEIYYKLMHLHTPL